jgi:hypothetical protein
MYLFEECLPLFAGSELEELLDRRIECSNISGADFKDGSVYHIRNSRASRSLGVSSPRRRIQMRNN